MDWSKYPNFSPDEFKCQCGCNGLVISERLIDVLQSIRDEYGRSMSIPSGYRCSAHPVESRKIERGGKPGTHYSGMACDVGVSGKDAYDLLKLMCADDRVKGIGVNQKGASRFLHMDVKEDGNRPNIWSY